MISRHYSLDTGITPKHYAIGAMIVIVALSNYLVQFPINDWLTWGALPYPISFLVTELTNRMYGPRVAKQVVWIGFCMAAFISGCLFPVRIAVASVTAFLVAQLLDILIFNKLRRKPWWYAPFFASLGASFVDTAIFWAIAFWGEPVPIFSLAAGDFFVKALIDGLMLTPFRLFINNSSQIFSFTFGNLRK